MNKTKFVKTVVAAFTIALFVGSTSCSSTKSSKDGWEGIQGATDENSSSEGGGNVAAEAEGSNASASAETPSDMKTESGSTDSSDNKEVATAPPEPPKAEEPVAK